MIKTTNRYVATEPMENQSVKVKSRHAFAGIEQKISVVGLKILFSGTIDDKEYSVGDTVYVRGESYVSPWAKRVFDLEGKSFILVPLDEVFLHETAG